MCLLDQIKKFVIIKIIIKNNNNNFDYYYYYYKQPYDSKIQNNNFAVKKNLVYSVG